MVKTYIEKIPNIYTTIEIDKYMIMPNHIHMIIMNYGIPAVDSEKNGTPRCASPTKSKLPKIINALKSLTSRQFGATMWQRSYHDHIIRNEAEYKKNMGIY